MADQIFQRLVFKQSATCPALLLTFVLLSAVWPHLCRAADADISPRQRFGQLWTTLRQQAPTLLPGLPLAHVLRDPELWAQNQLDDTKDLFGLSGGGEGDKGGTLGFFHPLAGLIQAPRAEEGEALWLSPTYHHKGMLPFHDALILGFGGRTTMLDDRLKLDLQPYYAQNWVSPQGYWGAQLSASFGPAKAAKPWGKISLGFTNGDAALMDHGHGFSLHSEWNIGDRFTLNAGVRSSEASRADNFVLMRWTLVGE